MSQCSQEINSFPNYLDISHVVSQNIRSFCDFCNYPFFPFFLIYFLLFPPTHFFFFSPLCSMGTQLHFFYFFHQFFLTFHSISPVRVLLNLLLSNSSSCKRYFNFSVHSCYHMFILYSITLINVVSCKSSLADFSRFST